MQINLYYVPRENDGGFDNGKLVESNKIKLNDLKPGSYLQLQSNGD